MRPPAARAPPRVSTEQTPHHRHERQAPMGKQHHDIGHQKRLRQKRERQLRSELRASSNYRSTRPRKDSREDVYPMR